jgi:hypothetical protein
MPRQQSTALLSSVQVWENSNTELLVWATHFTSKRAARLFVPEPVACHDSSRRSRQTATYSLASHRFPDQIGRTACGNGETEFQQCFKQFGRPNTFGLKAKKNLGADRQAIVVERAFDLAFKWHRSKTLARRRAAEIAASSTTFRLNASQTRPTRGPIADRSIRV